jgi:PTH1 family peptidyl-tRNA hydrolase
MQRIRRFWRRLWDGGFDSDPPSSALASPTRIIVGLGNPGQKYAATRHNIGFRVVELLAERFGAEWRDEPGLEARVCRIEIDSESCLLAQPRRFMNHSGAALQAVLANWPELDPQTDLLIIYDDMDLATGRLRLRPRGGSGGHRGIGDILRALDTKEIPRLRVGVGHPGSRAEVIDWVLEPFSSDEEALVLPELLARAADAVEATIREGIRSAMGQFNAVN